MASWNDIVNGPFFFFFDEGKLGERIRSQKRIRGFPLADDQHAPGSSLIRLLYNDFFSPVHPFKYEFLFLKQANTVAMV